MAWDPRTRDEIRDTLLADWGARAEAAGAPVDTREGSYAWLLAGALALVLEAQEAQVDALARELLPDTATTTFLDRHGAVDGVEREPAVAAVLQITVTGTPSALITFGTATLTAPDGTAYTPSQLADGTGGTVTLNGSGAATAYATCATAGTVGNQANTTALAWSARPTDADPTVEVAATTTAGAAAESDAAYALRILARRQERPAAGNRADWQAWCTEVDGVEDACVYPLLHPTYGTGTPGAVTVVALGPPQGTSATNTRVLSADKLQDIRDYIEGTGDSAGGTTGATSQKRPVNMMAGNYTIQETAQQFQDLDLSLSLTAVAGGGGTSAPFAYSAAYTVEAVPAPTTTTFSVTGDVAATITAGKDVLVRVVGSAVRGDYAKTTVTSSAYDGVSKTNIVVSPALPAAPFATGVVLPGLSTWSTIQAKVFEVFDTLGPGDTTPPSRWPGLDSRLGSTLYRNQLVAALVARYDADGVLLSGVPGILDVNVVTPAANVAAPAKTSVVLGQLLVRPA